VGEEKMIKRQEEKYRRNLFGVYCSQSQQFGAAVKRESFVQIQLGADKLPFFKRIRSGVETNVQ
jgi:hypothetical protein